MQWTDSAIILSSKKYGENSALLRVFSLENGVFGGVLRGAMSKQMRGIHQPGNIVSAAWQARLQEQLGSFKIELMEPIAAFVMNDPQRLSALTSLSILIESTLPERHPYPRLYNSVAYFMRLLKSEENWREAYVLMELQLLAEAGFGLDLSECAATGTTDDLVYVSPKSGRAVSRDAGLPYHDKLLPLPAFLIDPDKKNLAKHAEILDGMQMSGYFLEHWLLEPHHRKLPAARARLLQIMKETHAA